MFDLYFLKYLLCCFCGCLRRSVFNIRRLGGLNVWKMVWMLCMNFLNSLVFVIVFI